MRQQVEIKRDDKTWAGDIVNFKMYCDTNVIRHKGEFSGALALVEPGCTYIYYDIDVGEAVREIDTTSHLIYHIDFMDGTVVDAQICGGHKNVLTFAYRTIKMEQEQKQL